MDQYSYFLTILSVVCGCLGAALTYWFCKRRWQRQAALFSNAIETRDAMETIDWTTLTQLSGWDRLASALNRSQSQINHRFDQLRKSHDQISTVLSNMAEGVIAVDTDENILLANAASQKLLSIGKQNKIGRPLLEASRSKPLYDVFRRCLDTGQPLETEFETGSETRRQLSIRASIIPGVPAPGVLLVLHDVTELRRLENLRREFVANVSHELKTPLASIMAYAETLRRGAVNDRDHNLEFVQRIDEQAHRLHQLILDILRIARIETEEEVFELREVDVNQVIEPCGAQHAKAAERKEIQLIISLCPFPLCVLGDEEGVWTICDNLISNAIKYTPNGGEVTIQSSVEGVWAVIQVKDNGIGMSVDDQKRVFERFFRADKARSRSIDGTGLGLSIVKHLSQAFGGRVSVQSEPGMGSTFQVRIPIHKIVPLN